MERIIITMDREDGSVLNVRTETIENTDKIGNINLFCKFLANQYIKHLNDKEKNNWK